MDGITPSSPASARTDRLCLLIVIGFREDGVRAALAVEERVTASQPSLWRLVPRRSSASAAERAPPRRRGSGALGRGRRCGTCSPARGAALLVHTPRGNVIDALSKRLQPRSKGLLNEIIEAHPEPRKDASAGASRCSARSTAPSTQRGAGEASNPTAIRKPLTAFYIYSIRLPTPPSTGRPPPDHETRSKARFAATVRLPPPASTTGAWL